MSSVEVSAGDPRRACPARYERPGGRQIGDRIVHCHLPAGHPGEHEEVGTEVTWWGEHTPGRGLERLKRELPGMVPDLSEEDLRKADEIIGRAGSTPVPEEPAPPPVLPVDGFDQHVPVFTDVECPQCDGGRCDCLGKQVKICAADDEDWPCPPAAAYARGISEGRRQATEGWEREWGAQYRDDSWVQATFDDQASATEFAAGAIGHRAVSRLVGPWEPAEQPEPDWAARKQALDPAEFRRESLGQRPRAGYQCAFGGADCPGHSSKWLMCDPAAGGESRRPRMTDGCGPEHTYRGACAYAGEASGG